jgi:hypothetical protein
VRSQFASDFGQLRDHLAPRPSAVIRLSPDGEPHTGHLAAWVAGQKPGNRNGATFWAACRAAEVGDTDALVAIADAAIGIGLERDAVEKTIASAVRTAGQKSPSFQREAAP